MQLIQFAMDLDNAASRFGKLDRMIQAVVMDAAAYAYSRFGKMLLVTSLDRPTGSHSNMRCVDVDVCDAAVYEGGLLPKEAEQVATHSNGSFKYDPLRPHMYVAFYGHRDVNGKHYNHIHFQAHPNTDYV